MFDQLDLSNVLELACGKGRHSAQILDRAGAVTLVDANSTLIGECKRRFVDHKNVTCVTNSGSDLADIPSESQTAVFSYDAMVHFEPQDIINYVNEIGRVLKPGGRALLHYSNNEQNFQDYSASPEWRSFFTETMMRAFGWRAGLKIISSKTFPWGGSSDALTLLEKAAS
jgi:ubiquinone/menaquinone biosynthesis C-methylase UbiE